MSWTSGEKEILGRSEDEIRQDLLEQRMEKAAAAELANTASVIKNTGFFDKVDKVYGDIDVAREGGTPEGEEGAAGGGGGGLDLGGEGDDLDLEGGDEEGLDLGGDGDTGEGDDLDLGGDIEGGEQTEESIAKVGKILTEQKNLLMSKRARKIKKYKGNYMDKLVESINDDDNVIVENTKIFDKNLKINEDINDIINEIDNKLDE